MNRALLILDYSNDFIHDQGSLTNKEIGQAIDGEICRTINKFVAADDFIFICNDEHHAEDIYDSEVVMFPPHNIGGSWGAEIYGKSGELLRLLLEKQPEKTYYLPKRRFSGFFGTPLDVMLRQRNVTELTVVGYCTDISVLHTAIDAVYLEYQVKVQASACATFIEGGQQWAINHMQYFLGVEIE